MKLVPELVLNNTLSLISLSNCTWGASSDPNAAVAIRQPDWSPLPDTLSGTQMPFSACVPVPHVGGVVSSGGSSMHWPPDIICPGGHVTGGATMHVLDTGSYTVPVPHVGGGACIVTHCPLTTACPSGHVVSFGGGTSTIPEPLPPL